MPTKLINIYKVKYMTRIISSWGIVAVLTISLLIIAFFLTHKYRYALLMKVGFEPSSLCSGKTDIISLNNYLDNGGDVNLNIEVKDHELTEEYDDNLEYTGSLLHCAILFDQTQIVKLLLEHGANPNIYGFESDSNKNYQKAKTTPLLRTILRSADQEIILLLLDYGANPNFADQNGDIPFYSLSEKRKNYSDCSIGSTVFCNKQHNQ
jgi:ankyrin repeat protein